tara:strand:- start:1075 stop:1752 length:678 start_codon:yes stop_codon:yes gene_type:complete
MNKKEFEKTIKFVNFLTKKKYTYNFKWLGIDAIQFPSDLIVIQELIYKIKPNVIIETGVAKGGSLIFYSSILNLINQKYKKVIGIDILIKKKNKKKILKHPMSKNIQLIEGSSIDDKVIKKLRVKKNSKVLVILDSNHSEEHVLNELSIYSKIVSKGSYLIVLDTTIEYIDNNLNIKKNLFMRGNNPLTAVKKFLKKNKKFKIEKDLHEKSLVSNAYSGFLKKVK